MPSRDLGEYPSLVDAGSLARFLETVDLSLAPQDLGDLWLKDCEGKEGDPGVILSKGNFLVIAAEGRRLCLPLSGHLAKVAQDYVYSAVLARRGDKVTMTRVDPSQAMTLDGPAQAKM
jgi:hypothetical protein